MYFREQARPLFMEKFSTDLFLVDSVFPIWLVFEQQSHQGLFAIKKKNQSRVGYIDTQLNNCGLHVLTRDLLGFRREDLRRPPLWLTMFELLPALTANQHVQAPARLTS